MIAYDLQCSRGHLFEGWFQNSGAFEEQNTAKQVSCPFCNDTDIRKVISPVTMTSPSREEPEKEAVPIDYRRLAKEIVHYVNKNFEDVGHRFSSEALKMHYGVSEKRNIRGSATSDEERLLKEEKIEFFKIPVPRTDDDDKH